VTDSHAVAPARRAAFEVLRRTFEHGAWADRAFPAAAERHGLAGRDRAQAQHLAYGAVRRRGTSDALAERLSGRDAGRLDPPVVAALRLGLFELLFSGAHADHAAVDAAVELAKGGMRRAGGNRRAAGAAALVNAVLRRAARAREELLASLTDDSPPEAAIAHSVPEWLARMWWEELGVDPARALMRAVNQPPETALRINTLLAEPASLRSELQGAGEPVHEAPAVGAIALPDALVWAGPLGDAALAALRDGRLFAQSRGAQTVVAILDPQPGERILDLCAGPGVKTTAIAARLAGEGEVVAVERDPGRARQIEELAARAGARNVRVEVADATAAAPGQGYDRVLVDPPCSDLGTLASRPDARWRKDPAAIERLAAVQSAILARGLEAMASGGTLVYSTCTISERENAGVVRGSGPPPERWRVTETRPDRDGTDGFFIAKVGEGARR
jgi:16S rRNA (cytosine967-C5)-methyltransferase